MSRHTQGSLGIVGGIAAGIFLVAFVALMLLGGYTVSPAAFLAAVISLGAMIVLYLGFRSSPTTGVSHAEGQAAPNVAHRAGMAPTVPSSGSGSGAASATSGSGAATAATAGATAATTAGAAASESTGAAETATTEADASSAPAATEHTASTDAGAAAPETASEPPAAAMGEDYDGDGTVEGTDEGTRPAGLDAPRDGNADDLKQIKGIGPKLETLCNSLGFWHFDQIANWSSDEIAWVDANLEGFKGRVTRDDWVAQAKVLAAGGETEFSKRVEGGDVY